MHLGHQRNPEADTLESTLLVQLRLKREWWRFSFYEVFKLLSKVVKRHVRGRRKSRELMGVFEVIAPQTEHVTAGNRIAC